MHARIFASLALLLLGGCVSTPPAPVVTAHTLEGDPRLPSADIAKICPLPQWMALRTMEYRAYVILDGQILPDGSVTVSSVRTSYPDASWESLARTYAKQVELQHVRTTGTHVLATGDIFVVFFQPSQLGSKSVLTFGRQQDVTLPGTHGSEPARYIGIDTY